LYRDLIAYDTISKYFSVFAHPYRYKHSFHKSPQVCHVRNVSSYNSSVPNTTTTSDQDVIREASFPDTTSQETEHGRYLPEQDPVQGFLAESMVSMNTVKMPGGTKTDIKVCTGQGNNKAFLDFVMQVGGLIKRLSYCLAIEEANNALATAKQALVDAEAASKAAKREESKTRSKASASDAEKAAALEKKTAATNTVDQCLKKV
jgi:hypothetical protein